MKSKVKKLAVVTLVLSSILVLSGCDILGLNYSDTKARQAAFLYAAHHLPSNSFTLTDIVIPCEPNLDCPNAEISANYILSDSEKNLGKVTKLTAEEQLLEACDTIIKSSWNIINTDNRTYKKDGVDTPLLDEGGVLATCIKNGLAYKPGETIMEISGNLTSYAKFKDAKVHAVLLNEDSRIKLTLSFN